MPSISSISLILTTPRSPLKSPLYVDLDVFLSKNPLMVICLGKEVFSFLNEVPTILIYPP